MATVVLMLYLGIIAGCPVRAPAHDLHSVGPDIRKRLYRPWQQVTMRAPISMKASKHEGKPEWQRCHHCSDSRQNSDS